MDNSERNRRLALWIAGSAVLLSFAAALPFVLGAQFHADDFLLLPREQADWGTAAAGYLNHPDPEATHYYRPGCRIVQQSLQALFGSDPAVFHAWNLLLHLASVYLIYRLARSLTGDRLIAGIAAAIFLVHPAHDEPVIWITGISGLTDSLCHLAALAAFDAYLRMGQRRHGWLVPVFFLIALSHKESATAMLLTLPLLWWYRGHPRARTWPMVAVAVLAVGMAVWRGSIGVESAATWESLTFHPLAWTRNIIFYLLQFLLPVRTIFHVIGFDRYYQWRDALPVVPSAWVYMAGIVLLAAVASWAGARLWPRLPRAAKLGLGLALLAIAPLLISRYTGLRLLYLSSAFLSLALAAVMVWRRECPIMTRVAALWVVAMSVSWVERAVVWHDAGAVARQVMLEAAKARKHTPDHTAAVYRDVPRRHLGAFVFPIAFEAAVVHDAHAAPGSVFDYDNPRSDTTRIPARRMWYRWNGTRFEEVSPPGR